LSARGGQRVDFVIKNAEGTGTAKEVTSLTALKFAQLEKEMRIREVGEIFVREPGAKKLIEIDDISTVIHAR
ncbi:hypothetical protein, partial [Pseudomonas juntendi]|uniref:hypothetical protein n=1 Tax=Pseudomonas juntendi TaxID=2666183 RepID=UPI002447D065